MEISPVHKTGRIIMFDFNQEQLEKLRTTFRRAFYASACVTCLSAGFALYAGHQMQDGGPLDLHSQIDEQKIQNVMEKNPDYSKERARYELEKQADEFKNEVSRFGRNNTLILCAMTLAFYAGQRNPKNKNTPNP